MNFIKISSENLDTEHICCAISSKKDPQVVAKKELVKRETCRRTCVSERRHAR